VADFIIEAGRLDSFNNAGLLYNEKKILVAITATSSVKAQCLEVTELSTHSQTL